MLVYSLAYYMLCYIIFVATFWRNVINSLLFGPPTFHLDSLKAVSHVIVVYYMQDNM